MEIREGCWREDIERFGGNEDVEKVRRLWSEVALI